MGRVGVSRLKCRMLPTTPDDAVGDWHIPGDEQLVPERILAGKELVGQCLIEADRACRGHAGEGRGSSDQIVVEGKGPRREC
jgi:hypothetical protein